jgi:hypothetical protein
MLGVGRSCVLETATFSFQNPTITPDGMLLKARLKTMVQDLALRTTYHLTWRVIGRRANLGIIIVVLVVLI